MTVVASPCAWLTVGAASGRLDGAGKGREHGRLRRVEWDRPGNQVMRAANRVAIVTGASSGIGRALAMRLAAEGHGVGLIARRGDLLESLAGEIAVAGGTAAAAAADVGDRDSLRGAIADLEGRLGPTDVMVANAGFGAPTRLGASPG